MSYRSVYLRDHTIKKLKRIKEYKNLDTKHNSVAEQSFHNKYDSYSNYDILKTLELKNSKSLDLLTKKTSGNEIDQFIEMQLNCMSYTDTRKRNSNTGSRINNSLKKKSIQFQSF